MARRPSTYWVMGEIVVVAIMGVLAAILFAPRRPEAPPASRVSYEQKPAEQTETLHENVRTETRVDAAAPEPDVADKEVGGQFRIVGTVSDAQTKTPIPNAFIRCVRRRTAEEETAWRQQSAALGLEKNKSEAEQEELGRRESHVRTDKNGKYSIRVDRPGEYEFSVFRMGYLALREQKGTLDADRGELRMDFALSSGARVLGRITESGSGEPARGVKVKCEGASSANAVSDADGQYALAGLLPGNYAVTLDLAKTPYVSPGVIPSRNVSITTPTQEVKGIDFSVQTAGTVWGYVMNQKKEPVEGVEVFLCTAASMVSQVIEAGIKQTEPLHDRSEKNGYYELVGVPLSREWRLYAMSEERAPQLTDPFILTAGQRTVRVDVFLSSGSAVYGRVVSSADRRPIDGAEVACIPSYTKFFSPLNTPQAFRAERSGNDGRFVIQSLPVGDYQLLARKRGYKFNATGEPIYPDGLSDIRGLELQLTPVEGGEGEVYGTVTDDAGRPISDASVSLAYVGLEDLDGGDVHTRTDPAGQYAFAGLTDGVLILSASKNGYETKTVSDVHLNEATDIVLSAGSSVSGIVLVKETNAPVERFTVYARRSMASDRAGFPDILDGMSRSSSGGGDGTFTLSVSPGDYTIEARAPGLTPGRTAVNVGAGEKVTGVTIYMRNTGGRIAGRVTTTDKRSPSGALVWLAGGGAEFPLAGIGEGTTGLQVGEDGAFEFSNLAAGEYTVQAKLEGYAQSTATPVQLADGQTMTGIEVVLGRGSSLEGTVSFDGRLEAGAIVTVVGNGVTEMTTSDSGGHYQFEHLTPGTYLASAVSFRGGSVAGLFSPLHARVEIVEGQPTVYNFGEPTNTALVGYCIPKPPAGMAGAYALLTTSDAQIDLEALNLMNPMSWFSEGSALSSFIVGMAPVEGDGFFRIDNLVAGEYVLIVFYAKVTDVFSRRLPWQVGGAPVRIENGQTAEIEVPVVWE